MRHYESAAMWLEENSIARYSVLVATRPRTKYLDKNGLDKVHNEKTIHNSTLLRCFQNISTCHLNRQNISTDKDRFDRFLRYHQGRNTFHSRKFPLPLDMFFAIRHTELRVSWYCSSLPSTTPGRDPCFKMVGSVGWHIVPGIRRYPRSNSVQRDLCLLKHAEIMKKSRVNCRCC